MPCERMPMRYGHSEGHTEVCFDDSGKFLVTCGNDGDVRIWESLDDDDPKFITVGEKVYSVALKNGKLVTASSNNTVQVHTFPDGDPDGILTRFTTNATHITFNSSGTRVAAGSSDFMVKVVDVADSSQQKTLRGHEAPVLSVTFDPKDEYLASSSCDGSVVVWNIEEQSQVKSWNLLQKSSDVTNATSLCRLSWQNQTAKFLAVPVDSKVHLYERGSWDQVGTLSDDQLTQPINVVSWSPCGRFLAAGCIGGLMTVWDVDNRLCVERQKHEKGFTVCSLAWHPSGHQIAYTDTEGSLGLLDGLSSASSTSNSTKAPINKPVKNYDDLFDDDDDQLMDEGLSDTNTPVKKPTTTTADEDDDDDDYLMPATGRVRNRGTFLDDDNSMGELGQDKDGDDDASSAVVPAAAPPQIPLRPIYEGPLPTPPQKAFQPGSTPAHLTHRFMVRHWEDGRKKKSLLDANVVFTGILTRSHFYLDQICVLFKCAVTNHMMSNKLQCLHFSSWDTNKDWMVDLPPGEDVRALCLGRGWAAVATSSLMVRLFSVGGAQREVFSLPGPVVCMSGHGEQLLIVYHRAAGFDGDQALGVQLLQFGGRKRQVVHGEPLPLSPKAHLSWVGFTAEGTPCFVDSEGVVRMLNRSLGNTWTPVCNTRETCKSKSDHYWVVGVHENPQQLRCIPCKGSRYPPTLPRPAVAILPFKIPLCQTTTEKGQMEEQFWRSVLFHNHYSFLSSSGYEIDEEAQNQSHKEQQELLMKMFALSCKLEREFRCVELAELMTQNVVTLAIRYASRSRRMALAQRLSEIALEKASQSREEEEEEEAEFNSVRQNSGNRHEEEEEDDEEEEPQGEDEEEEGQETETETRKREFARVTNILDNMSSSRKPGPLSGSAGKGSKGPVLKPLAPRPKTKTQSTLLQMSGSKSADRKVNAEVNAKTPSQADQPPPLATPTEDSENTRPKTGFQLWLEENRKSITADCPDLEETEVIKEAMGRFRTLTAEERMSWTERAKGPGGDAGDLKKRKREGGDGAENDVAETDQNNAKKKKSVDASSKLSAFAFNKN
uniref:WD repeat and HMG-box DNA-binding protein 1 n=1 Tax=Sphaeramia orbicularis TaxID=375764 RepID=A0A672ZVI2_9TELE